METRAHYILIGAFMLSAIILTILFALWLGTVEQDLDEYDVIFNERVSGLSVGSDVLFNGIVAGEVRDLNWAPNNPEQVIARVQVSKKTPIKVDTKAELELVGVTGLSVIQFSGGKPGSPLLKDISKKRVPQLQASLSVAASIIQGGGNIVASIQGLLSEENTATIGNILEDVDELTGVLVEEKESIRRMIKNVETVTKNAAIFSNDLDKTSARIDRILEDIETLVATDASNTLKSVDQTSEEVLLLVQELRSILEENRESIDNFAQQGLGETAGAIADTRRLIRTMDNIMREIERDPARFFLGDAKPEVKATN